MPAPRGHPSIQSSFASSQRRSTSQSIPDQQTIERAYPLPLPAVAFHRLQHLALPSLGGREPAQALVNPHMVVEPPELVELAPAALPRLAARACAAAASKFRTSARCARSARDA